jgi:hypothetical protein
MLCAGRGMQYSSSASQARMSVKLVVSTIWSDVDGPHPSTCHAPGWPNTCEGRSGKAFCNSKLFQQLLAACSGDLGHSTWMSTQLCASAALHLADFFCSSHACGFAVQAPGLGPWALVR